MRRSNNGFTLIELILVMALIAILSVVGIGAYTQATLKSRDTERKSDLNQVVKALESFNNDIGRYPKVNNGVMTCPSADKTEVACPKSIYAYIGTERAMYMGAVPIDPDSTRKYVYIPNADQTSYALYAALENPEDKDAVVDNSGKVTNWDSDYGSPKCGGVSCNYKVTETGLIRVK